MMKKKCIIYIACLIPLIWVGASYIDTVINNGNEKPKYAPWNVFTWIRETETETENCEVVSCENANGNYRITIEDTNGNLWAYYDSDKREIGETIIPIWSENGNEIIGIIEGGN